MIHNEIDEDTHSALFAASRKFDEVAESAISRIDTVVIRYIITVVLAGRGLKRHQPQGGDSESLQVIQPAQQSLEIPYTVAICIHISGNR